MANTPFLSKRAPYFADIPDEKWNNWRWQVKHILREAKEISSLVRLTSEEREVINYAKKNNLPFGITPHYLALMDDDIEHGRDKAIRAAPARPWHLLLISPPHTRAMTSRYGCRGCCPRW